MARDSCPVTPAVRFLRAHGIAFAPRLYAYEDKGGTRRSAGELGVSEHTVIKTLVMETEQKLPFLVLMHGDREVSTRRLARVRPLRRRKSDAARTIRPAIVQDGHRHHNRNRGGTMPARTTLTMYEEILLLALDDRKGTAGLDSGHALAMGGAILAELVLLGALRIGADKKKFVDAEPGAQVDDPLLGECLALVRAAKRRKRAVEWVAKFAGLKDLKNRAARGLVTKGVLNEAQDKVLGLFPRAIFPARDPGPEAALIERLRQAVLTDGDRVDERTLVVAVIAHATSMLPRVIAKKELKARRARLKQLAEGSLAGGATAEAVQAAQAAVMAVMIATTAAAAASS